MIYSEVLFTACPDMFKPFFPTFLDRRAGSASPKALYIDQFYSLGRD